MARADAASYRLQRRVADFVAAGQVLCSGERVLLLLSGGADSMALLALLPVVDRRLGLGLEPAALHVDYATRGADSTRDRRLVETACAAAEVPLHVLRLRRRPEGPGFQARARDLRYGRAREIAAAEGYGAIVTAHNRDDQAETVLYRLAKYATPRGLTGMRPRDGALARPLLCLGAVEIREYCARNGIAYGEDVSNAATVYARNRVRLEVLPPLRGINPQVAETLAATAELAAAEAGVLAEVTAAAAARVRAEPAAGDVAAVDLAALAAEPPALRALLLHEFARDALGGEALVGRRSVAALLALTQRTDDAGRVDLGRGLEAVRGGGQLRLRRRTPVHACTATTLAGAELAAAGEDGVAAGWCGRRLRLRLLDGAVFDLAAVRRGEAFVALPRPPRRVELRHPRRGERFAPLGLGGETTVARFLAAARVPAAARPLALAVAVDGDVAWVGYGAAGAPLCGRVAQSRRVVESSPCTLHISQEDT